MDLIICSLCSKLKDDPRIVGVCHHSFCLACIKEHCQITTDDRGQTISTCPQCQLNFKAPEGGLESLRKNEFLIKFRDCYMSTMLCSVCSEDMVVYRCEECKEHYCDKCSVYHLKFKATREHKLTKVRENSKLNKYFECQLHAKDIEIFCPECSAFVCSCCYIEQHNGHKAMMISNKFEEVKQGLSDAVIHKNKLLQLIPDQINDINSLKNSSRERAVIVKSNILSRGEKLKSLIDSQVVDLCSTLEQSLLLFQSKVDSTVEHLKYLSGSLEGEIRDYENQFQNLDFRTVTEYPDPFKQKADPVIPDFNEIFTPEFESTVGKFILSDDSLIESIKYAITAIDGGVTQAIDRQPKPNVSGGEKKNRNKKNSKNLTQTALGTRASKTLEAPTWREVESLPVFTPRASKTLEAPTWREVESMPVFTPSSKNLTQTALGTRASKTLEAPTWREVESMPVFTPRAGQAQVIAGETFGATFQKLPYNLPPLRTAQLNFSNFRFIYKK